MSLQAQHNGGILDVHKVKVCRGCVLCAVRMPRAHFSYYAVTKSHTLGYLGHHCCLMLGILEVLLEGYGIA